ncbi:MAG: hypothetical protein WCO13_13250 [Bacteroidota bacterium]
MNTTNEILLVSFCITSVAMGLFIIQLLLRKLKPKSELGNKIKISYGAWVFFLFTALSINTAKTLDLLGEAFDLITKSNTENTLLNIFQTSSIFIGLNILWFVIWLSISNVLSIILIGKRNVSKEMENNNISYFLIRGVILIGIIISFLTLYESLLRAFLPTINAPFYH